MSISIDEALEVIRRGEILILTDDEDRENEGDFVCAAEFCTAEIMNFMATHGRGLICATMPIERLNALRIRRMVQENTALMGTNFMVSVDYLHNTSTGISAEDRSQTVRALADPKSKPEDFARPGHIFPIASMAGGVLERVGHTEASVDLARLAGLQEVGLLVEILNEDGSMARRPDLDILATTHGLKIATINDLIDYRLQNEKIINCVGETRIPNEYGEWRLLLYENIMNGEVHSAMIMGKPEENPKGALVRVHSQCFTGDTLGSQRCDCQAQLHTAMRQIAKEGQGILLYMQQEGRGIGLKNKIKAYALQDHGKDTVEANEALGFEADMRHYNVAAQILKDLGLEQLRLMTNNPRKIRGIEESGIKVLERIPIEVGENDQNIFYLKTKQAKLGHLLTKTK